jgi:hypothetical protein
LNKDQPRPASKASLIDHQSRVMSSRNSQYANDQKGKTSNILTGQLGDYKLQFTLLRHTQEVMIKCSPITTGQNLKKLTCTYQYDKLPSAVKITYQSI